MFPPPERKTLLEIARKSIEEGLRAGKALKPHVEDYPPVLRETGASFVTLLRNEELRGCIGTLEARMPLVTDVAKNAFLAAFEDPRFPALAQEEFADLQISLSLLTQPEGLSVA